MFDGFEVFDVEVDGVRIYGRRGGSGPHTAVGGRRSGGGSFVVKVQDQLTGGRVIKMDAKNLADLYGLPPVDWERVEARLSRGPDALAGTGGSDNRSWLATTNADGSPHLTGLGPLYVSGLFYFTTGEATRKARNLARDPRCTLGISTDEFDLAVEGDAALVDDPDVVADLVRRWVDGGWPARVDATGTALTAEYSAPSAGPPPWRVYRITPRQATVVLAAAPGGATRWRFP